MTHRRAMLLSLTVPLSWGVAYTFMKFSVSGGVPPMTVVALRCGIAFLITFAIFFRRVVHIDRRTLAASAVVGALLFSDFFVILMGVKLTTASIAGFLQSTTVIIVPLLHAIWRRKLPDRRIILGVVIVTAGLFLLNGASFAGITTGSLFCLASGLLYALHILATKHFVMQVDSLSLGIWQLGFASLFALITSFLTEQPALPQTAVEWTGVLGLAIICSAYGFVMQAVVQKHVSPETTGFMFSLESVFAAGFAFLILGERMGALGYLGAALIFGGVWIANAAGDEETDRSSPGAAPALSAVTK